MALLTSGLLRHARLFTHATTCPPNAFVTFQHISNVTTNTRLWTALCTRRTFAASAHRADAAALATNTTATSAVYDFLLRIPSTLLDCAHYIGLPWWAAIPASAVIVRGTLLYYWCLLPSWKSNVEMSRLTPLIHAKYRSLIRIRAAERAEKMMEEVDKQGGGIMEMIEETEAQKRWSSLRRMVSYSLTSRAMRRRFGLPSAFAAGVRSFGVLILMTEGIRAKCGASAGLLSLLARTIDQGVGMKSWQDLPQNADVDKTRYGSSAQAVEIMGTASPPLADGAESAIESGEALRSLTTQLPEDIPAQAVASTNTMHSPFFDPGVLYEGLPWCLDLTAPDPYHILPALLFGIYITRTVLTIPKRTVEITHDSAESDSTSGRPPSPYADVFPKEGKTAHPYDVSKAGRHMVMGFAIHSALYHFIYLDLPAAIMLYLLSSSVVSLTQQRWLAMRYPMPSRITPCHRPTQEKTVGTMMIDSTNAK